MSRQRFYKDSNDRTKNSTSPPGWKCSACSSITAGSVAAGATVAFNRGRVGEFGPLDIVSRSSGSESDESEDDMDMTELRLSDVKDEKRSRWLARDETRKGM